jgi:hypothetical protein
MKVKDFISKINEHGGVYGYDIRWFIAYTWANLVTYGVIGTADEYQRGIIDICARYMFKAGHALENLKSSYESEEDRKVNLERLKNARDKTDGKGKKRKRSIEDFIREQEAKHWEEFYKRETFETDLFNEEEETETETEKNDEKQNKRIKIKDECVDVCVEFRQTVS